MDSFTAIDTNLIPQLLRIHKTEVYIHVYYYYYYITSYSLIFPANWSTLLLIDVFYSGNCWFF